MDHLIKERINNVNILKQSVVSEKIMTYICTQYDLPRFSLDQRTWGGLRVFNP